MTERIDKMKCAAAVVRLFGLFPTARNMEPWNVVICAMAIGLLCFSGVKLERRATITLHLGALIAAVDVYL